MNRSARMFALAGVILATSAGMSLAQTDEASASKAAVQGELPSGWEVLDRSVEAIGGKDRYMKIKSIVATGTFLMPMMGAEGEIVRTTAAPNMLHMEIDLGMMGRVVQATDGEVVWAIQPPMDSVVILSGEQAQDLLDSAGFYDRVQPRKKYESAEVLGVEEINGKPCYEVSLLAKNGDSSVAYYEIESGNAVKIMTRASEESEVFDAIIEMSDFREVDGVVFAFGMKQKANGMEFEIAFETIELDAAIEDDLFSPPSDI